jgi:signal transduction histidine kinase
MAAVADSAALLDILCNAATTQCHGTGAAVVKTEADAGVVVAASGGIATAKGRRFPLGGSLMREVLATHDVVAVSGFSASARPLARVVPELRIGPMLLSPLMAHDALLGGIAVTRDESMPPFTPDERAQLRVIADHAALALWKAELLEKTQAADQAKSRFLATISHELRTPLTALTGYEELLADRVLGPLTDAQCDILARMRSVTQHLTGMIEEVLAYSSLEAGNEVVRPSEFLAADLVRSAAAIVEPTARHKRLRILRDLPAEPIRMTSDIEKLRQIVVNLAGNAVKFTDEGEIQLGLTRGLGEVRFSVRDTGIGIAPSDLPYLFRPFTQLDTGLTRRHGGTGLGLYISRQLALILGGRIEVESELGKGSTFTLVVPA